MSVLVEPTRRRASWPDEAIVPTMTAAINSAIAVSRSSREAIVSDRYGLVRKKSKDITAASAVRMPAARPPIAAMATTTIIRTRAALVLLTSERGIASRAATMITAGVPIAHPISRPVRSTPSGRSAHVATPSANQATSAAVRPFTGLEARPHGIVPPPSRLPPPKRRRPAGAGASLAASCRRSSNAC